MSDAVVLWRRLDLPGHEAVRLTERDSGRRLAGTAVFRYERRACRLDYLVACDSRWRTVSTKIRGWVGTERIAVDVSVDSNRLWRINGIGCPEVTGCSDVDLNFSPSTNLLPVRRLDLKVGQEAEVRAAFVRFPEFTLEPLDQLYRRVAVATYRYESAGGRFAVDLEVDAAGLVARYPGFWEIEDA